MSGSTRLSFTRGALKVLGSGKDPAQTKAGELAQGEAVTIGADDDVSEILRTMASHKVRQLSVIDGHDRVGMVALADVAKALPDARIGDLLPPTSGHGVQYVSSSGRKRFSIGSPNTAAILNASGRLGS